MCFLPKSGGPSLIGLKLSAPVLPPLLLQASTSTTATASRQHSHAPSTSSKRVRVTPSRTRRPNRFIRCDCSTTRQRRSAPRWQPTAMKYWNRHEGMLKPYTDQDIFDSFGKVQRLRWHDKWDRIDPGQTVTCPSPLGEGFCIRLL